MRATEHHRPAARAVAGDAQVDWRLQNALQLQLAVNLAPRIREHARRLGVGFLEHALNALPHLVRAHQQEVPRLHEADRRRMVRSHQQAGEHVIRNGRRQKLTAHVAATENGLVNGSALY